jgi:hypothetical protein
MISHICQVNYSIATRRLLATHNEGRRVKGEPAIQIGVGLHTGSTKADFEPGLLHYFAKDFAKASVCFKNVLKANADDKIARLYLQRSAQFMVQGVAEDWEGVEAVESK